MWIDETECCGVFFFQAEDGIRDLVRSRGLGDVYKRQEEGVAGVDLHDVVDEGHAHDAGQVDRLGGIVGQHLSLIHI